VTEIAADTAVVSRFLELLYSPVTASRFFNSQQLHHHYNFSSRKNICLQFFTATRKVTKQQHQQPQF